MSRERNAPGGSNQPPLQFSIGDSTLGRQWIAPTNITMLSPESFMVYNNLTFLAARQDEMAKTLDKIAAHLTTPAARSAATTSSAQASRREKLQRTVTLSSERFRPIVESLVSAWEEQGKMVLEIDAGESRTRSRRQLRSKTSSNNSQRSRSESDSAEPVAPTQAAKGKQPAGKAPAGRGRGRGRGGESRKA
ncbi:hypothetical protein BKA81DRAFT_398300 [Phyllosticta paracitricarpa]